MNTEKQFEIGEYREKVEKLNAIKNAWENLKNLKENFCNPYSDNFICVDFETDETITDAIEKIEDALKKIETQTKEEKTDAEIKLEFCGINPREIDEIIFS